VILEAQDRIGQTDLKISERQLLITEASRRIEEAEIE
jgi:hypothetical protein